MKTALSVYLDAARFLAALAVFFSHVGASFLSGGFLWQAGSLGAPAVAVFFVLSGFVIGHVSETRETTARRFIVARAARLYSVVVPVLFLTACLDWYGASLNPRLYAHVAQLFGPGALGLPESLTFLHMAWGGGARRFAGSNVAYWSLGYEAIYYVVFAIWHYGRGKSRVVGCLAVLTLAGPHITALFPMWLLGVAACRYRSRVQIGRMAAWTGFVGSIAAAGLYLRFQTASVNMAGHTAGELAQDYLLALIFVVNLVAFDAIPSSTGNIAGRLAAPIRWVAGATFTLYLLHLPLLFLVRAAAPWPVPSWPFRVALIAVPLCGVYLFAQITERDKDGWRRGFEWLWDRTAQRVRRSGVL